MLVGRALPLLPPVKMSISSFIVTSLQLGLDTLAAKAEGQGQGLTKEALPVLEGFIAATEVLIESAEEVGAASGDPIMRDGIFDYAKKIRLQSNVLQVSSVACLSDWCGGSNACMASRGYSRLSRRKIPCRMKRCTRSW